MKLTAPHPHGIPSPFPGEDPAAPYRMLELRLATLAGEQPGAIMEPVQRLSVGLTWTSCRSAGGLGFAMTLGGQTRVLPWPGTIAGKPLPELADWLFSRWDPIETAVGLAAVNAMINRPTNSLLQAAEPVTAEGPGNLSVFTHFRPRLDRRKIVVIGRYPGLDTLLEGLDVTVLERLPGSGDLPDTAAEYVLPRADWVFLSATTLMNRTFPRLAALSRNAVTVLMGPSTPWLADWADYGIDFLAGVEVTDPDRAEQTAMEGGGTRLFENGVRYRIADIGQARMDGVKQEIAGLYARREKLKQDMNAWFEGGADRPFPGMRDLESLDLKLSGMDMLYKRLWDARHRKPGAA